MIPLHQASRVGVDLIVLDDGWFGKRNDITTSLGVSSAVYIQYSLIWYNHFLLMDVVVDYRVLQYCTYYLILY